MKDASSSYSSRILAKELLSYDANLRFSSFEFIYLPCHIVVCW